MRWIALLPHEACPASGTVGADADADASADADAAALDARTALAWQALRFTPRVAFEAEAVVMEVSASLRLWGGAARLVRELRAACPAPVRAAQGATALVALARLRLAVQARAQPAHVPAGLPLDTLDAAAPHHETLMRTGCRTWGDVRALPRSGVARRFGAPLLEALDQAWGERPEQHEWLALPEVFTVRRELPALAESAPALMFGAQRLLSLFGAWLRARQRGALAFELHWSLDVRRRQRATEAEGALVIRTATPTQDLAHLARLLGEHLAHLTLPAPAHTLGLRSLETAPLAGANTSLLPGERTPGDSLQQLVERLGARLGTERVLEAVPQADHRPEAMQRWQPAGGRPASVQRRGTTDAARPAALYPGWLLREPQRLAVQRNRPQYHGPLQLLAGPERLEAGWWGAGTAEPLAVRDYFVARSPRVGLIWIFREHQGGEGWFLHGLYG